VLVSVDLGGTKTAISLSEMDSPLEFIKYQVYLNAEYKSFEEVLDEFSSNISFDKLVLGIAGPVSSLIVKPTHLNWNINKVNLEDRYECKVILLNDLEAAAYAIPFLKAEQTLTLQETEVNRENEIIVSVGTGIGKAQIFHREQMIYPSETGHVGFAARTKFQRIFSSFIEENYGYPSYEMVVSSIGFHHLRKFLLSSMYFDISSEFDQKLRISKEVPKLIFETSLLTNDDAKLCQHILDEFSSIIGVFLSDLVLIHLPSRVLLTGGIGRNIMNHKQMLNSFVNRDQMREILSSTGLAIVTDPDVGLKGVAIYGSIKFR